MKVLIVGAGLSGLVAAQRLTDEGHTVTVVDKARGVGGRMATRRMDGYRFDHGAQFFTVRDARFAEAVQRWEVRGLVRVWSDGFPSKVAGDDNIAGEVSAGAGHPRYVCAGGMTALPKHLAESLDVELSSRIVRLELVGGAVRARAEDGRDYEANAAILSSPIPQSLAMLDEGEVPIAQDTRSLLSSILYDPCLGVLLWGQEGLSSLPEPGAVQPSSGELRFIADNARKGVSEQGPAITAHFAPDFSRRHYDATDEEVYRAARATLSEYLNLNGDTQYQVKRWRYSQPSMVHGERYVEVAERPRVLLCGDAFGGPKLEGAYLSGMEAAQRLSSVL
jgi:predicted NAD/FAD-dependent oxidoreductase